MKIQLISLSTPTFNNVRAASALPYHLIKEYADKADFEVYSYNINNIDDEGIKKIEKELNIKINLLKIPWWMIWMFKFHVGGLRLLLKHPYLSYLHLSDKLAQEIRDKQADLIWIYGEELAGLSKIFQGCKCIVTMPDCESMFYYRMLKLNWNTESITETLKYAFAYWQYRNMEKKFFMPEVIYHFVGKEDAAFFRKINTGANAFFLPHPLYAYNDLKTIAFHQPKIRILFTGRYDLYCKHGTDELLQAFIEYKDELNVHYEITFLGKGWTRWNILLMEVGYTSQHIDFAPNYIEELQKHDIQINAIDVGTGTKGKVLDAFANGLLVIGTPFALENIEIEKEKSCIQYFHIQDLVMTLHDIPHNIEKYEQMAQFGKLSVLQNHNNLKISEELFSLNR